MRIEVDVLAAEQSWDFATKRQQNYLVIEVFGIQARVPCTEEQLIGAIADADGLAPSASTEREASTQDGPRQAPVTFMELPAELEQAGGPHLEAAPRRLAPLQRQRGDDVGIAQG
jgi:hypothetical protein